jgi:hypothetical protein
VLSGHEHNFQHAVVNGIHYVVSGAAGKLRPEPPSGFADAGTRTWAASGHLLLARADEERIVVLPVAEDTFEPIEVRDPDGRPAAAIVELTYRK